MAVQDYQHARLHHRPRRHCLLGLIMLLFTGLVTAEDSDQVLLLKAGFISKFPSYVDWPATDQRNQSFTFCLYRAERLRRQLQAVTDHVQVLDRPTRVIGLSSLGHAEDCHVLFLGGEADANLEELLQGLADHPMLTVADSPGFAARGVQINLYRDDNRIRFEINRPAARARGLDFDFRLLEMARLVQP